MAGKDKQEPTTAELAQAEQDAVAAAIGEAEPPREPVEAKPDKRNAIQIERDQQALVEKSIHNITIVEGKP